MSALLVIGLLAARTVSLLAPSESNAYARRLISGDYFVLSTAHALHYEARWLTDEHVAPNNGQLTHPGVPFQFASWAGYRLSCAWLTSRLWPSAEECAPLIFRNALTYNFFNVTLFAAIAFVSIGCMVVLLTAFDDTLSIALLVPLLGSAPILSSLFGQPGNDFLAPVLGAASFLNLRWATASLSEGRQRYLFHFALCGVLLGTAYACRLNYLAWGIGIVMLLLLAVAV